MPSEFRPTEFFSFLQRMPLLRRSPERLDQFRRNFHNEIFWTIVWLYSAGVLSPHSEDLHLDPPSSCQLCSTSLTKYAFFVDGRTNTGEWAIICPLCYERVGTGIGFGVGQLYHRTADDEWCLIAGADEGDG
jgi:hypothetical protein